MEHGGDLRPDLNAHKERFAYTAYGVMLALNPTDFSFPYTGTDYDWTILFTGRALDDESGLYYYRMRYYHPGLGVFVSRDPIGPEAKTNLSNYCEGKPVDYFDPSGQQPTVFPWGYDPGDWRLWEIRYPEFFRLPDWFGGGSHGGSLPPAARSDTQCCIDAASRGLDSGKLGDVICCDGRWVICAYNYQSESLNPKAQGIIVGCVFEHGRCHLRIGDFPR